MPTGFVAGQFPFLFASSLSTFYYYNIYSIKLSVASIFLSKVIFFFIIFFYDNINYLEWLNEINLKKKNEIYYITKKKNINKLVKLNNIQSLKFSWNFDISTCVFNLIYYYHLIGKASYFKREIYISLCQKKKSSINKIL